MKKLATALLCVLLCGLAHAYTDNPKEAYQEGHYSGLFYTKEQSLEWFKGLTEAEVKETAEVQAFRHNYLWKNAAYRAWIKGWLEGYLDNYNLAIRRGQ